jgi:predicted dehydrogenase
MRWALRALEAGKHVLCEKPLAANAEEADRIVAAVRRSGRVVQEAMQVRYSWRLRRQRELVASGDFGRLRHIESCFRAPNVKMAPDDFRLSFELAGGAGLDLGCYSVTCLRHVAGEDPEVVAVRYRTAGRQVDRWMRATCRLPSGASARIECGFRGWYTIRLGVVARCERGWIRWVAKGLEYSIDGRKVVEPMPPEWTQQLQMAAFAARCRGQVSDAGLPEDSAATARVIDAMYRRAGLAPRGSALPS